MNVDRLCSQIYGQLPNMLSSLCQYSDLSFFLIDRQSKKLQSIQVEYSDHFLSKVIPEVCESCSLNVMMS